MRKSLLLVLLASLPALAQTPSVSGTWKLALVVNGNTYPMSCTIQQDAGKLTGACKSESGENPLKGQVDGQKITFQHQTPYNGDLITLSYTGTIASASEIKGTIDVQPFNVSGEFTGQKDAAGSK